MRKIHHVENVLPTYLNLMLFQKYFVAYFMFQFVFDKFFDTCHLNDIHKPF